MLVAKTQVSLAAGRELRPGGSVCAQKRYGRTMSLELVPLATATIKLAEPMAVSSSLMIGEIVGVAFEGDRVRATMRGNAGADWLRVSPDGTATLDVRMTLETDDGAMIFTEYTGRLRLDTMTVYAAPLYHTADERYQWMNTIQAVAKGQFTEPGVLIYEIYELV